jgi:hypothetical protein
MATMNARLALTHPNQKRLLAWLDRSTFDASTRAGDRTVRVDQAVTAHVESCERCADRLEQLSIAEAGAGDEAADIGHALRTAYEPPIGMTDRVLRAIDDRKRADEEISLFLGLFSIVSDAADLMLPDDDRSESNTNDETRRDREDEI